MQHEKANDRPVDNRAMETCWLLQHGQKRTPRQHSFVCEHSLAGQKVNGGNTGLVSEVTALKPGRQYGAGEPSQKQMQQGGDCPHPYYF